MKKKIVQVVPSFHVGGAETLVKNYLLNIDREMYDIEAFVTGKREYTSIECELEHHGIKVTYLSELYKVNSKAPNLIKRLQIAKGWRNAVKTYFRETKPTVVHCHLSVARTLIVANKELKNVKMFYTVHSDPDKYWDNGKNFDEQDAIRFFMQHNDFCFIALHDDAISKIHKYYGNESKVHILNNGVDVQTYAFAPEKREKMRAKLCVSKDAYVIGHVGRFLEVKNHAFLLEVFKHIVDKWPNALLCLVGDGELKKEIIDKAELLGIGNSLLLLGDRSDVYDILPMFDAFVFPSLWEGFPLTLIEAQAARLPCFVSDSVSHEVALTNLVTFIKLETGTEHWANTIMSYDKSEYRDIHLYKYDIKNVVKELLRVYEV